MMEFDDIIVGAGSAGCVLAARLSEDPARRVCLVEAGGPDDVLVRAPLGFVLCAALGRHLYPWETEPQAGLGGRRGFQPRGKVLGGSSAVNAMVYCRGNRYDYDSWAALGNPGWDYAGVLPYFKRAEHCECLRGGSGVGAVKGAVNLPQPRMQSGHASVGAARKRAGRRPLSRTASPKHPRGCRAPRNPP